MKEIVKKKLGQSAKSAGTSIKWVAFALITGLVVGSIATMFHFSISIATMVREKTPWIIFLLPIGGLIIVRCYRMVKDEKELSTNSVLSAIHSNEKLPLKMAPLIFVSSNPRLRLEHSGHGGAVAGKKNRTWKNLKQILAAERALPWQLNDPNCELSRPSYVFIMFRLGTSL